MGSHGAVAHEEAVHHQRQVKGNAARQQLSGQALFLTRQGMKGPPSPIGESFSLWLEKKLRVNLGFRGQYWHKEKQQYVVQTRCESGQYCRPSLGACPPNITPVSRPGFPSCEIKTKKGFSPNAHLLHPSQITQAMVEPGICFVKRKASVGHRPCGRRLRASVSLFIGQSAHANPLHRAALLYGKQIRSSRGQSSRRCR